MYTVTIIRLNPDTMSFQNTEVNQVMLEHDVAFELGEMGCGTNDLGIFNSMKKGDNHTFESLIDTGVKRGLRFAYVFKIN